MPASSMVPVTSSTNSWVAGSSCGRRTVKSATARSTRRMDMGPLSHGRRAPFGTRVRQRGPTTPRSRSAAMGKVVSSAMMSLDGYIAKADNTIGRLFDCLNNGEVDVPTDWVDAHPEASLTFVTDGVGAAVDSAKEIAGDRNVAVAAGTIARQALELGLLDEVAVDLVPVVMGQGKPYFGQMGVTDVMLGDPTTCIRGERV